MKTSNQAHVARLGKPEIAPRVGSGRGVRAPGRHQRGVHNGVPLLKPPYAHLIAIDLNRGTIAWRVPFGDTAVAAAASRR